MKVSKLIKLLQHEDPDKQCYVSVGEVEGEEFKVVDIMDVESKSVIIMATNE